MGLLILLVAWALFAGLGRYVSGAKGRPAAEGLVLGGLFGPLGCLIAALLPSVAPVAPARRRPAPRVSWDLHGDPAAEAAEEEEDAYRYLAGLGPPEPAEPIDMEGIRRAASVPRRGTRPH